MLKRMIAIALIALQASSVTPIRRVPAALIASAALGTTEFVMVLAHAGVPAGLEIRAADYMPNRRPNFEFAREPRVTVTEVVAAFNAAHTDYQAKLIENVVVIRPVRGSASYLDQQSSAGHIEVIGVISAARRIFAPLDPTLDARGGHIGSRIGMDGEQSGENAPIRLNGEGRTNEQLLNDVVSQSPRAWIVITDIHGMTLEVARSGFIHQAGASTFLDITRRQTAK
jgi:hypothetical protein